MTMTTEKRSIEMDVPIIGESLMQVHGNDVTMKTWVAILTFCVLMGGLVFNAGGWAVSLNALSDDVSAMRADMAHFAATAELNRNELSRRESIITGNTSRIDTLERKIDDMYTILLELRNDIE